MQNGLVRLTCYAVGGGAGPSVQAHRVSIRVTAVVTGAVVGVYAVPGAVGVVVVGRAVPLVPDIEVDVRASASPVHVSVIVIVFAGIVEVIVTVVHDCVVTAILVHRLVEQLVVVL